jgi:hypothetical protein
MGTPFFVFAAHAGLLIRALSMVAAATPMNLRLVAIALASSYFHLEIGPGLHP